MGSANYRRLVDALLVESEALDEITLASRLPSRAVELLRFRLGRRPNAESLHALGNALAHSATTYAQHNEAVQCQEKAWARAEHPGAALVLARRADANMEPLAACAFYAQAAWYLAARKRWHNSHRDVHSEFLYEFAYPYERDPHTAAMRGLGNLLLSNHPERAYSYFCRAAEEFFDPASVAWLADGLVYGRFRLPTDPRRALRILLRSVKLCKCPDAAVRAARLLLTGCYGVKPRPRKALKLYYRAVTAGRADAMCEVADALRRGTSGLGTHFNRAHALYRAAVNNTLQSSPPPPYRTSTIAQNDTSPSHAATTADDVNVNSVNVNGSISTTAIAHELTTKLVVLPVIDSVKARAQTPDPVGTAVQAHFSLSYMLISGMGQVREDEETSASHLLSGIRLGGCWAEWWTRERMESTLEPEDTASLRAANALHNATETASSMSELRPLAEMLLVGRGAVIADPRNAVKLFVRALHAEQDSTQPTSPEYNRSLRAIADVLMGTMAVRRRDISEAARLYNQAAEQGDLLAMRDFAHVLAQGLHGTKMNEQRAYELWAAASGADTPNPHIPTLRAVRDSCNNRGCTQQAIVLYERALTSATNSPAHSQVQAVAMCMDLAHLHRRSNPQRAAELFRRALPHAPRAASYLAEMRLWGEDSPPDAEEALCICESAQRNDERSRAMLAYILNHIYASGPAGGPTGHTARHTDSPVGRNMQVRRARRALKNAVDTDGRAYVQSVIRFMRSRDQPQHL